MFGLLKNKVIKNASWIILCRIMQSVLNLVIGMISARYLGASNYGLISYAASLAAFVVPMVQLGLRHTLVQEIVAKPEREGKTLGTALLMSTLTSFLGIIGIAAFVMIANRGETDTLIVCTLYSISLIFQMTEMIKYWYQAKLLSKYTSITSLVSYTVVSAYKIYLLISQKSMYWFALNSALDYFIISVVLIIIYLKIGKQKFSFSAALAKDLFSRSKYYIVSTMMVTIFSQTDKIMLKSMSGKAVTGFYSAAFTCSSVMSFVYEAIIDSARPVIFESKKNDQEKFEKNVSRLYSIIIYTGLAQSIVFTAAAWIIVMVLFGEDYIAAVPVLQVLSWGIAFSYMGSVRNIWILAEQKQKILWIINLSGAVLNIIGNFILIPVCGATGAAIASVLTQFFTNFVLCFVIKYIRQSSKLIISALNPKILLSLIKKRG